VHAIFWLKTYASDGLLAFSPFKGITKPAQQQLQRKFMNTSWSALLTNEEVSETCNVLHFAFTKQTN